MSNNIDVSVVIITHNKFSYLEACLNCLGQCDFAKNRFEVIVVNDGSTDNTQPFLDAYCATYLFTAIHKDQGGIASARNVGIARAVGELLVMLDEDCLLSPTTLQNLWDAYRADNASLLIANVIHIDARHVSNVCAGVNQGSMEFMEKINDLRPSTNTFALQPILRGIKENLDDLVVGWIGAQGPSVSMGRQQWAELGGYDETFRKYGMEDFDLAFRFQSRGGRLRYIKNAILFHLDHGHEKTKLFAEATLTVKQFYRKHANAVEARPFLDFILGGDTFLTFNNRVAQLIAKPPIDKPELDIRFCAYEMVKYRDSQSAKEQPAPPSYRYNNSQQFCLNILVKKLREDIGLTPFLSKEYLTFDKSTQGHVLVVAPHMDDEVIGCGGAMRRCAEADIRVSVVFCSSGTGRVLKRTDVIADASQVIEKRIQESKKAASILGVNQVLYLHGAEGRLGKNHEGATALIDLCNRESVDTLFVPGSREMHPDHIAVSRWISGQLSRLTQTRHVFEYEVWGSCTPTHHIDLDPAAWESKRNALLAYETQLQELDYLAVMELITTERGRQTQSASGRAEAYRRLR